MLQPLARSLSINCSGWPLSSCECVQPVRQQSSEHVAMCLRLLLQGIACVQLLQLLLQPC